MYGVPNPYVMSHTHTHTNYVECPRCSFSHTVYTVMINFHASIRIYIEKSVSVCVRACVRACVCAKEDIWIYG